MKSKVKFEDVKTMLFSFVDTSRNWLFSFDIKSGYHHIDIFPPDQEFLGFSWFKDWVYSFLQIYCFTFRPFHCPLYIYESHEALSALLAPSGFQNGCIFG